MPAPDAVLKLVDHFDRSIDALKSGHYKETQVRQEFIDPLFNALGWDVYNTAGNAEAYKDVILEDTVRVGGATKAPDYCFRVGGTRKFFLEAKKPSVNLKDDTSPAFQLRRYAWSAKLPLSILTDFEELAVYDCRVRPVRTDKASTARTIYLKYEEYEKRWDEIASIFSREAVLQGSFDKYVKSTKAKRGTAEVDSAFLAEIESWREILARNLALRNPTLTQRELNHAVQRTIDRIIFLRICEDRGIESYGRLQALLNGARLYPRLCELFRSADDRYNSGLFHFRKEPGREDPDEFTLALAIDDRVLKNIIKRLYYPDSPYEFSVLPADILGQVYEQFLGKVIRLTAGHRAKVEDKPEVKKAGGVYYTPTYIVDYIVKNTVGKLVEGKTPGQVAKLRILDPACGSGSFLIGAYEYLLDWHRDNYLSAGPKKHRKKLYEGPGGDWRLTTSEKKRILLNNIYGVDIDPQAVEVTKLSLLLKVLEGETGDTLESQLKLFHERALPDLGNNIKCGNSLIEPDYYDGLQPDLLSGETRHRVNAFSWTKEFPSVRRMQGFDAVIGNPPYVFGGNYGMAKTDKAYFKRTYYAGSGKVNLFTLFMEQAIELLRIGGRMSFIIPNTFLRVTSYAKSREFVLRETAIESIVDLGVGVFKGATTSSVIIVLRREPDAGENRIEARVGLSSKPLHFKQLDFMSGSFLLNIRVAPKEGLLLSKMCRDTVPLGDLCAELIFGVVITKNRDDVVSTRCQRGYKKFLEGRDIGRYYIRPVNKFLLYDREQLHRPRTAKIFETEEKLLIQRITGGDRPLKAAYDDKQHYDKESINNLILKEDQPCNIKYVLGLLNSSLISWFYNKRFTNESTLTVNISKAYLSLIPIRAVEFSNREERVQHDDMVALVDEILRLHVQVANARTSNEKTELKRRIENVDSRIDQLVYVLYGLDKGEIRMVEDNMSGGGRTPT